MDTRQWDDGAVDLPIRDRAGWFVLKQDKRGRWRAYFRQTFESYSLAFDHGGHTIHYRDFALRLEWTGNPIPPLADKDAMAAVVKAALEAGELLPYGT